MLWVGGIDVGDVASDKVWWQCWRQSYGDGGIMEVVVNVIKSLLVTKKKFE